MISINYSINDILSLIEKEIKKQSMAGKCLSSLDSPRKLKAFFNCNIQLKLDWQWQLIQLEFFKVMFKT